jgi:DNA-binding NtrC family response regulator
MSTSKHILIVEDEMLIALHIEDTLAQLGHQVETALTAAEANHRIEAGGIDLAIVDYNVTDGTTETLMARLQEAGVPFMICSGVTEQAARNGKRADTPFLAKPFSSDALIDAVSALLPTQANRHDCH